jgi:hypothetical protein
MRFPCQTGIVTNSFADSVRKQEPSANVCIYVLRAIYTIAQFFIKNIHRNMALYGPFYAGKNAPMKAKWQPKPKNPTRKSVRKTVRKNTPALSPKSSCSLAARQLGSCRGTKKTANAARCKTAAKTLSGCRKKKKML